jgi:hypothetical protein
VLLAWLKSGKHTRLNTGHWYHLLTCAYQNTICTAGPVQPHILLCRSWGSAHLGNHSLHHPAHSLAGQEAVLLDTLVPQVLAGQQ